MIKIGIVGSDNSHAIAFSKLTNVPGPDGKPKISGARVVRLFGLDAARNEEVAREGQIDKIVEKPEDMLGEVDAVMVVFRHGNLHLKYALPFISAGIPTFVDKPFAIDIQDCLKMLDTAEKAGTLLTSYSTVRYARDVADFAKEAEKIGEVKCGSVLGPCDLNSQYGGAYFYGTHAIETMLRVFGYDIESIVAREAGGNVAATVRFKNERMVSLWLLGPKVAMTYQVGAAGSSGALHKILDISSCYEEGLKVFLEMIQTGKRPLDRRQLLTPIKVVETILKALDSKREELFSLPV
ncbi:MAG TPA: Gfo/Idh/MocA family oxidoreductase [Firmicutes bacterium]|nr:Gfo/Idh/MocA family oxidoreductase [Bacillota bacterium]